MRKLYFSESNKTNPKYTRLRMSQLLKLHRHHVKAFWNELHNNDGLNLTTKFHSRRAALIVELHPTIYFQEV